jgi:glycosyltransferase involved in cell wall biosynthesis
MAVYFSISDLVRFARRGQHLSGIQRVHLNLLKNAAALPAFEEARCLYDLGGWSRVWACSLVDLFGTVVDHVADDRQTILSRLGIPPRADPWRELLIACGREMVGTRSPEQGPAIGRWAARPGGDDTILHLGANWKPSGTERFSRQVHAEGGRVIQLVYDLIAIKHPEYCRDGVGRSVRRFLARSTTMTTHYLCNSRAVQADLKAYLEARGRGQSVSVLPLPHEFPGWPRNSRGTVPDDPAVERQTAEPFVLCVGTIEVRKNGVRLLQAWQRLLAELGDETPCLVFAGSYGWKIDDFRELLASDARLADRVRVVERPTDADLASLYERCLFTVYPSLAEGWGLPVGEAAWFGKWSIVSNATSLPEVCGDLVEYVDPLNTEGLAHGVASALRMRAGETDGNQTLGTARLRTWRDLAVDLADIVRPST